MKLNMPVVQDPATLLQWTIDDPTNASRCLIAMHRLQMYLEAARTQMGRLTQELEAARSAPGTSFAAPQQQAFVDMHLYFVLWCAIDQMLRLLVRRSGYAGLNTVYKQHRSELKHYCDARDHLEHFDQRLPGGGKVKDLKAPGDLGNLVGGKFTLGGDEWDVSPKSLERLAAIVDQFTAAVVAEGRQRWELKRSPKPSLPP